MRSVSMQMGNVHACQLNHSNRRILQTQFMSVCDDDGGLSRATKIETNGIVKNCIKVRKAAG